MLSGIFFEATTYGARANVSCLAEKTPPSMRIKISNSFMNNLYAIEHTVNVISIRLEGGVSSTNQFMFIIIP